MIIAGDFYGCQIDRAEDGSLTVFCDGKQIGSKHAEMWQALQAAKKIGKPQSTAVIPPLVEDDEDDSPSDVPFKEFK